VRADKISSQLWTAASRRVNCYYRTLMHTWLSQQLCFYLSGFDAVSANLYKAAEPAGYHDEAVVAVVTPIPSAKKPRAGGMVHESLGGLGRIIKIARC